MKARVGQAVLGALALAFSAVGCGGTVNSGGEGGTGATGSGGSGGSGASGASGVGGAGGGSFGSCDALPDVPKLAACARPKNDPMSPPNAFNISLSGPILAMGDVNTPGSCFYEDPSYLDPNAFWFEAADGNGETWIVGISFPALTKTLAPGDMIAADIAFEFGGWGPNVGSFSLRDGNNNLLAHIAEGGDLPDLTLPQGISVAQGAAVCKKEDVCGTWSAYDLEVTANGTAKTVAYGASDTVGSYRVVHGGYELASSYTSMCADWFVAHVEVGIAPLP